MRFNDSIELDELFTQEEIYTLQETLYQIHEEDTEPAVIKFLDEHLQKDATIVLEGQEFK